MDLRLTTKTDNARATVSVAGEVDVSNAGSLREAVDAALAAEGLQALDVDMGEVPYIDSTGIGVLVGAAHKARDAGVAFSVANAQDNVVRIMGMLGVDEVVDIRRA